MADKVPPVIQEFLIDPSKAVEKRLKEIETALTDFEKRANKAVGGAASAGVDTGAAASSIDAIAKAVTGLETTVANVSKSIDASFKTLGESIQNSLLAALNAFDQKFKETSNNLKTPPRPPGGTGPTASSGGFGGSAEANSILGVIESTSGLTQRVEGLNRVVQEFSGDLAPAARLAQTAIDALSNSTGTFEERLNRVNNASKQIKDFGKTTALDIASLQKQRAELKGSIIGEEDPEQLRATQQDIANITNVIDNLSITQRVAAASTKALADQFGVLKLQAQEAGQVVKTTSTGLTSTTPGVGPRITPTASADLAANVNAILSLISQTEGLAQRIAGLNRFVSEFATTYPEAARLADIAVKALSDDTGTLEEKLNRVANASRVLKDTNATIGTTVTGLQQKLTGLQANREELVTNKADKSQIAEVDAEINQLTLTIRKLRIEQSLAKDGSKALEDKFKTLSVSAKDAGQKIVQTGQGFKTIDNVTAPATVKIQGLHQAMLALLGVSRFLPGPIGSVVSGLGLMAGTITSLPAVVIALAGSLAVLAFKYLELGANINFTVNKLRAQAEGIGLTVAETRALQAVVEQTDGSIENFTVGLRKISEGISGVGASSKSVRTALELAFGSEFQLKGRRSVEVLQLLAVRLKEMNDAGLTGLANSISGIIFGRNFDEVQGRLGDLIDTFDRFKKETEANPAFSEANQKLAKEFAVQIEEIKLQFEGLLAVTKAPNAVALLLKGISDQASIAKLQVTELVDILSFASDQEIKKHVGDQLREQFIRDSSDALSRLSPEAKKKAAEAAKLVEEAIKRLQGTDQEGPKDTTASEDAVAEARRGLTQQEITNALGEKSKELLQLDLATAQTKANDAKTRLNTIRTTIQSTNDTRQRQLKEGKDASVATQQLAELAKSEGSATTAFLLETAKVNKIQEQIKKINQDKKQRTEEQNQEALSFTDTIEELRDNLRLAVEAGRPLGDITKQIADQFLERFQALQAGITGKTDPGAARELKERARLIGTIFFEQLQLSKQAAGEEVAKTSSLIDEIRKANDDALSRGRKTISENAVETIKNIGAVGLVFEVQHKRIIDQLNKQITLVSQLQSQTTDPRALAALGQTRAKLEIDRTKEENEIKENARQRASAITDIERSTNRQLIDARQQLRDQDIELEEAASKRKVDLIQRTANEILSVEDQAIRLRAEQEKKGLQARIDAQLNFFNDLRNLETNISGLDKGGGPTGIIGQVKKATGLDLGDLSAVRNASAQAIDSVIAFVQSQGADAPPQLVKILTELLRLKEQIRDIDQETATGIQDANLKRQERLLDITKNELSIKSALLGIETDRLNILNSEGLLSKADVTAQQVELDKKRIAQIQQEVELLRQRARLEIDRRVAVLKQTPDVKITPDVINQELNTGPIAQIIQSFIQLNAESQDLAIKLKLADTNMGAFRNGVINLIEVVQSLPDPFNRLSKVLSGVKQILDAFVVKGIQNSPTEATTVVQEFKDQVLNQMIEAVKEFREKLLGPDAAPTPPPGTAASTGVAGSQDKAALAKARARTTGLLLNAATQVIEGLASGSAGGLVSGIGGAVGSIVSAFTKIGSVAGPLIGGIAQIAGGVFDFIGGIFKKRIEKIANTIEDSIKVINDKLHAGSITLGQAVAELQTQAASARAQLTHGKVGKKGGKEQAAQIEKEIQSQIEELRRQAKETQDKFQQNLEDLRLPPELRSAAQSIRDAFEQVKEFLGSFENQADALNHIGDAQEFLNRTLGELRESAIDDLNALLKSEQDAARAFEKQRLDLINQGRVQTGFEQAQDKLIALFELEKKRAEERAKSQTDQAKLEQTIDFVDRAFGRASDVIDSMRTAFENLATRLDSIFGGGASGIGLGRAGSGALQDALTLRSAQVLGSGASGVIEGKFSVNITAGSPTEAGIRVADAMEARLQKLGLVGKVTGVQTSSRPFRP